MDSENEIFLNNWPRFLIVESVKEDLALQKRSPFAIQKGFQAIARTQKSIKRLRDGPFLVECGKTAQAQNLLQMNRFVDRPVRLLSSQDPKLLSGSYQVSGPCGHVRG